MTILVFGYDGQLGSEVIKAAQELELSTTGLNRDDVDLSDKIGIKQAIEFSNADIVINCAGYTNVDGAENNQNEANIVNGDAVAAMARACAAENIPLIHISTDYVFDGQKGAPYTPDDEPVPLNAYGLSKLIGEQACEALCPKHIVVRTSWVFGIAGGNFVKTMLRLGKQRDKLDIISDQIGCPTSARSLASALTTMAQAALKDDFDQWGIYHYSNTPQGTWYDFAREIFDTANLNVTANPVNSDDYPMEAKRPLYSVMDCSKTWDIFNLKPVSWVEEVKRVIYALQAG